MRISVLISGGGSTLANLIDRIRDQRLRNVAIAQVISSRAAVRGVEIAKAAGLPVRVIRRRDFDSDDAFGRATATALDEAAPELVVMGGYLCLLPIDERYRGRVVNIHPALLPKFGGRGMYGRAVHEAVLRAGESTTGCTVHVADQSYDHGPTIAQARVPVLPEDTADDLAQRVAAAERELYPLVLQRVADNGLAWLSRAQSSPLIVGNSDHR